MSNLIKKSVYTISGLGLLWVNSINTHAGDMFWTNRATNDIIWEERALETALQWYIGTLMTFLYILAVAYALWGWFQILTAGWDEEKVKKWKTILIQWAIWLLVIFISGSLVKWVLWVLWA